MLYNALNFIFNWVWTYFIVAAIFSIISSDKVRVIYKIAYFFCNLYMTPFIWGVVLPNIIDYTRSFSLFIKLLILVIHTMIFVIFAYFFIKVVLQPFFGIGRFIVISFGALFFIAIGLEQIKIFKDNCFFGSYPPKSFGLFKKFSNIPQIFIDEKRRFWEFCNNQKVWKVFNHPANNQIMQVSPNGIIIWSEKDS